MNSLTAFALLFLATAAHAGIAEQVSREAARGREMGQGQVPTGMGMGMGAGMGAGMGMGPVATPILPEPLIAATSNALIYYDIYGQSQVIYTDAVTISAFAVSSAGVAGLDLTVEGNRVLAYFDASGAISGGLDYDAEAPLQLTGLAGIGTVIGPNGFAAVGSLGEVPVLVLLEVDTPRIVDGGPLDTPASGVAFDPATSEFFLSFQDGPNSIVVGVIGETNRVAVIGNLYIRTLSFFGGRLYATAVTDTASPHDGLYAIDIAASTAEFVASPEAGRLYGVISAAQFLRNTPQKNLESVIQGIVAEVTAH